MQRHSSLLILLVLLLFTTSSTAQPYILQHLSIGDGLSNNYVQDIAQDKRGCIWIATVLGLNRFDGLKFTTYKSTNSTYLIVQQSSSGNVLHQKISQSTIFQTWLLLLTAEYGLSVTLAR